MMANPQVLIIEDDPTMLLGLRDNFVAGGYRVRTAGDGRVGLADALDDPPDLILLDVMLPGVHGYEICRRIREQELDMPIILLTAKTDEEDVVRGLELGADDYVTKPFSIRELLARAQAFLRRRANQPASGHSFGGHFLDLTSHRLMKDGREVRLTDKEFRLLNYFLQRRGCALTRSDILRAVWGSTVIVTHRSVDRCVTTLRSKIEPDSRRPRYIKTVRDIGYRFELAED